MSLAPQYLNTRTSYAIEILTRLIQAPSVTPCDAGTIAFMSEQLAGLGFTTEQFEVQGVKKFNCELSLF